VCTLGNHRSSETQLDSNGILPRGAIANRDG
jgi:hypothetical protein